MFNAILKEAEAHLLSTSGGATPFAHRGVRGDERAASLKPFLQDHLPSNLATGKGEILDCNDRRSRQIDLFIYDRAASAPIATGEENLLLPCETVYAVIEVKSRLTQDELDSAYLNAASVRKLRPFKKQFVGARTDGEASDGSSRCMYFLFAFDTNLSEDQWLLKEHSRMTSAAASAKVDPDAIDRIIVLGRGIIAPPQRSGRVVAASDREGVFFEFYVHLMNFLNRERSRRPPVDWQVYAPRTVPGWQHL